MQYSAADYLMDVANAATLQKRELLIYDSSKLCGCISAEAFCDRVALALKFRARPGLYLRATLEEWPMQRIVQELY